MKTVTKDIIGTAYSPEVTAVDNATLIAVNKKIRGHSIEEVGAILRQAMTDMKIIKSVA
jgi:ketol-acid reductoisomerase